MERGKGCARGWPLPRSMRRKRVPPICVVLVERPREGSTGQAQQLRGACRKLRFWTSLAATYFFHPEGPPQRSAGVCGEGEKHGQRQRRAARAGRGRIE